MEDCRILDNRLVDYWFDEVRSLLDKAQAFGDLTTEMFKNKFLSNEWICVKTDGCVFVGYPMFYRGEKSFWMVFETGANYKVELNYFMNLLAKQLKCKNILGLISPVKARLYKIKYPKLHNGARKNHYDVIDIHCSNYAVDIDPTLTVEYLQPYNIEEWWSSFVNETVFDIYERETGYTSRELKLAVYTGKWSVIKIGGTWIVAKIEKNSLRNEFAILFLSGELVKSSLATILREAETRFCCRYVSFAYEYKYANWIESLAKKWRVKSTKRFCYSFPLF